jgi:hypothetical protein
MNRWLLRVLALPLALVLFAACSSDDPEAQDSAQTPADQPAGASAAPAAYIDGLCTAVVTYKADLEAENRAFQDSISGDSPSPEATKEALVTFLSTAADRTQQLIDDVEALGTPDVDNGGEVRSTFTSAFQQVIDLFESARSDIEALSTEDPAALAQGFTEVATKLQEAGTEIGSTLDDLESPELDEAAVDVPSCESVA